MLKCDMYIYKITCIIGHLEKYRIFHIANAVLPVSSYTMFFHPPPSLH